MKRLAPALILALGSSVVAASPARAQRGAVVAGVGLGGQDHARFNSLTIGLHTAAEFQLGWVRVGGTLGTSGSRSGGEAPISARTMAAHAGLAVPIARRGAAGSAREIRGLASLELGRHSYAPRGTTSQFLGPTMTYDGPRQSTQFTGARAGLSFAQTDIGGRGAGIVVQFELAGRRDHDTVGLDYTYERCGGLFGGSTCTTGTGSSRAGGTEVLFLLSAGLVIGR